MFKEATKFQIEISVRGRRTEAKIISGRALWTYSTRRSVVSIYIGVLMCTHVHMRCLHPVDLPVSVASSFSGLAAVSFIYIVSERCMIYCDRHPICVLENGELSIQRLNFQKIYMHMC